MAKKPAAGATDRATDYRFDLAMTTLAAGDYLLKVKATTTEGANEKTIRFSQR